jgi:S-DNA-T family DNA segregation ATPase FtsK/SpoIIIE
MAARQQAPQKPLTIPILLVAIAAGAAAIYAGAPGMLLVAVGVIVAANMHPPAQFTGPKDKGTGYPTAAHGGEESEMAQYRFWSDVKTSAFSLETIAPGLPVKLAWVYALIAGAAAAVLLPCDGESFAALLKITDMPELITAITDYGWAANGISAFILVGSITSAKRRNAASGPPAPAVTFAHFGTMAKEDIGAFVGMLLAGVIAGSAVAAVLAILAPVYQQWVAIPAWGWFLTVVPAGAFAILGAKLTVTARANWELMIAGNEEWKPRWENVKMNPAPQMLNRKMMGNIVIDEFETVAGTPVSTYIDLGLRNTLIVPDYMVFILSRPKIDDQGQDIKHTQHPTRFQVVLWPEGETPDVTDASTSLDVMTLWVRSQLPLGSFGGGLFPTYQLDRLELLSVAPAYTAEVSSSIEGQVVAYVKKKDRVEQPPADTASNAPAAIWRIIWWRPSGAADPRMFRERCVGSLSGALGAHVAVDHRGDNGNGCAYFGALGDMGALDPQAGMDPDVIPNILEEDDWTAKWANADSKFGVNPPLPQFPTKQVAQLANGVEVNKIAFMCRQGVTPSTFFGMEEVLKTAMGGIPFVAITGFPDSSARGGERHPLAFTLYWAEDVIPVKPELVRPVPGPDGGTRGGSEAPNWILAGLVNQAFKAARLPQPEMVSADSLSGVGTGMRAVSSNLWRIQLRLYGGATLSDVRAQTRRIQESLATEWLRIVERPDGCTIVMGANPRKLKITDQSTRDYIENLNWQQAWEAAKVVGLGGKMPKLVSTKQFPSNDQVTEIIFDIPEGLSVSSFREAREKLKTASGNGFIQVDPVAENAKQVKLTVSEIDPMPVRAPYDWEFLKEAKGFPIGVGVTGEPIQFLPRDHIHFLVTGSAGSGKSVTMQTQVVAAIARGFDLYIADPAKGATDFSFAKPYSKAFCTTISDTAAMLQGVYKEVQRRVDLIKSTPGSANIYQLPAEMNLRPIALVLDEFTSMIGANHIDKGDMVDEEAVQEREDAILENGEKQKIGMFVAKIAREARSAGVSLIMGTQKLAVKDLDQIPGGNTLKNNLSRSIAGKSSQGDRMSALREPFEAPAASSSSHRRASPSSSKAGTTPGSRQRSPRSWSARGTPSSAPTRSWTSICTVPGSARPNRSP